MGMVAIIEEKGKMNLGLAIPAGILTVVAAGTCETHISLERRYVHENALQPKQIYLSRALGLSTRSVRKQWFDIRIISSGRQNLRDTHYPMIN